ncbi:MAG: TOBE domain-containing protein [Methylococcaceae bacterium]|jgi:molybdate transport system regulatory protein
MSNTSSIKAMPTSWVEGDLRLAGALDSRMIALLRAINLTGSINQAAKQAGLSYKGAWQMIERANNLAPKVLVATSTGGSKGGGTNLTGAGLSLLHLFDDLQQQHQQFLHTLNQNLAADPELMLLLKPLAIKTSATNQLFGRITNIKLGAVNAELSVQLKGGEQVIVSLALETVSALALNTGLDVLLIINAPEISVIVGNLAHLSARNCLQGTVVRSQQDGVDSEVVVRLAGGDSLTATITQISSDTLSIEVGTAVCLAFKSNAVLLAVMANTALNKVENN